MAASEADIWIRLLQRAMSGRIPMTNEFTIVDATKVAFTRNREVSQFEIVPNGEHASATPY
jgi:hypothetical protein